jgi:hypothetical protein
MPNQTLSLQVTFDLHALVQDTYDLDGAAVV